MRKDNFFLATTFIFYINCTKKSSTQKNLTQKLNLVLGSTKFIQQKYRNKEEQLQTYFKYIFYFNYIYTYLNLNIPLYSSSFFYCYRTRIVYVDTWERVWTSLRSLKTVTCFKLLKIGWPSSSHQPEICSAQTQPHYRPS